MAVDLPSGARGAAAGVIMRAFALEVGRRVGSKTSSHELKTDRTNGCFRVSRSEAPKAEIRREADDQSSDDLIDTPNLQLEINFALMREYEIAIFQSLKFKEPEPGSQSAFKKIIYFQCLR
ncbi:hypothetical protein GGR90_003585 [Sphingopyxis italica]|uniref:Uncharacterized protein n=1 Tax=Sphingopyxis italica TaxID=1129133 RepID=A0A7X5XU62_9SPHN|nr:hypothetical protein [Sphingopyxis italica]NJB91374.1 hypothetical protein [Sphingopyxis italica]